MHYHLLQRITRSFALFLLLLISTFSFAQDPAPTVPTPVTPPAQQVPAQPTPAAPVTNSQAVEFYNQAKSAGMSDMDIEKAALQRGYTLDDISAMRKRLQQTSKDNTKNDPNRDEIDDSRQQSDEDETKDDASKNNDTTNSGDARSLLLSRTFGSSFFNKASATFEPNLRIATPKNYVLGPDDEIVVDIFGNSVDNFRMKISPEGTVKMLNLAPVYVNGLTIEQANDRIVNRLRQAYSSLNKPGSGTYSTITLGSVRSIRILITGEAHRPGSYTVSSLATAFNALYLSGGPGVNGSYRNIEVIRNGKVVRKIDLYKFLVDADLRDNIALQDQDIILIRPYDIRLELAGEIKKTGIFEALNGESIQDIIRYASGYTPSAFTKLIQYQRNTGNNFIVGSLDSLQMITFQPRSGDIYTVRKVLDIVANQVEIRGPVTRPGKYPLDERTKTLKDLINIAQGIGPRAFMNRALLERSGGDLQSGFIPIDLNKLLNNEIADIALLPGDILTIKSIDELRESSFVSINGSVINPGIYQFNNNITISDLIFMSGGYTEGGIPYRIEVSRRVKNDTLNLVKNQNVRIFTVDVPDDLKMDDSAKKFLLQPFDIVLVRKSPRYEIQKLVSIEGEVTYPGKYTILNNFERISDLLIKTGGLKASAYLEGARFYRGNEQIAVNITNIVSNPNSSANLLLQDGDNLVIPRKSEVIRLQGGVYNPSIINYDKKFNFKEYISQAGGFVEKARKSRVYVSYPNGRTKRTTHFLFLRSYPAIEPGSVVTVPVKEPKTEQPMSRGERIAIISLATTLVLTVARLF
jgi:polysaccharide export outer membrane protein